MTDFEIARKINELENQMCVKIKAGQFRVARKFEGAKNRNKLYNSDDYQFDLRYCICLSLEFGHCLSAETSNPQG